jgi:hypothetical protein
MSLIITDLPYSVLLSSDRHIFKEDMFDLLFLLPILISGFLPLETTCLLLFLALLKNKKIAS